MECFSFAYSYNLILLIISLAAFGASLLYIIRKA